MNLYIPQSLYVSEARTLPTTTGRSLKLQPQEFIPYSFSFRILEQGDEVDVIASTVRLTDSDGTIWAGDSIWMADNFIFQVGRLGATISPVLEKSADENFKNIFKSGLFLEKARGLLDDRFYRTLSLGGVIYSVPMKYQSPVIDLAADYSKIVDLVSLYVRIHNLYGYVEGNEDQVILPPFIAPIEALDQLFINYYIQEAPGCWTREQIPSLVRFHPTSERATPNRLVIVES